MRAFGSPVFNFPITKFPNYSIVPESQSLSNYKLPITKLQIQDPYIG